ncbi:MAG: amidohydrolase family protein [Thaumarchaeota archaeon]|nr:amidohydrolase family protein [Nitrososphaerota archaeon]
MIIDSHQHFWDITRFRYNWMTPAKKLLIRNYLPGDLNPIMKDVGVVGTVLVQAHDSKEEGEWLLSLAESNDFVKGVVVWIDPRRTDVDKTLVKLSSSPKLKGVRYQVEDELDDEWLLRDDVILGLKEVARFGLPFDLLVRTRQLKTIPILAGKVDGLRMVLDHMAKPEIAAHGMEPWKSEMAKVAAIPGMYCKISGLVTEADWNKWTNEDLKPYLRLALELFGTERLMWGSDWPVCLLASPYGRVLRATSDAIGPLNKSESEKIFYLNAKHFYNLP